jgi:hypothetical protein
MKMRLAILPCILLITCAWQSTWADEQKPTGTHAGAMAFTSLATLGLLERGARTQRRLRGLERAGRTSALSLAALDIRRAGLTEVDRGFYSFVLAYRYRHGRRLLLKELDQERRAAAFFGTASLALITLPLINGDPDQNLALFAGPDEFSFAWHWRL